MAPVEEVMVPEEQLWFPWKSGPWGPRIRPCKFGL